MKRINYMVIFLSTVFMIFHTFWDASYFANVRTVSQSWSSHDEIKVVSYNIQHGRGQDGMIDFNRTLTKLKNLDADILCIQEVERYSVRSGLDDQVDLIAKELGMNAIFYPSISIPGLNYGNAIFSKYPILNSSYLPFSSQRENRSLIMAEVALNKKQSIYVMGTHLGLDKQEREVHISEIFDYISSLDKPIILAGDLNTTPEQDEYSVWSGKLRKSNQGVKLKTYSHKDWQIDYIFSTPHFQVVETWTLESDTSDHYPVASIFKLE